MQLSTDTMLYQGAPGHYGADFGGVSIDLDLCQRHAKVFVSYLDATDQDYADVQSVLSRFGIPGFNDAYWDDDAVCVLVAHF